MLDAILEKSFSKEVEYNQMELKNRNEIKPKDGVNIRREGAEERISEVEDRTIENTQPEQQKRNYCGWNCVSTIPQPPIHAEALTNVTVFRDRV